MYTLLEFGADWCQPCKAIAPHVERLVRSYGLSFQKIDVDKDARMVSQYNISAVPTLTILSKNNEVARFMGAPAARELQKWLEERIAKVA